MKTVHRKGILESGYLAWGAFMTMAILAMLTYFYIREIPLVIIILFVGAFAVAYFYPSLN